MTRLWTLGSDRLPVPKVWLAALLSIYFYIQKKKIKPSNSYCKQTNYNRKNSDPEGRDLGPGYATS